MTDETLAKMAAATSIEEMNRLYAEAQGTAEQRWQALVAEMTPGVQRWAKLNPAQCGHHQWSIESMHITSGSVRVTLLHDCYRDHRSYAYAPQRAIVPQDVLMED